MFDSGVTGIVGPNGCGKSNIVDAITWVMGEQSAKHLRGASMEDVIFGGSEGYAPSGLAEVTMTLENDGGLFPTKYSSLTEVMVTRRLHRSGESEYLVNKEQARLKDIQEIFMDTGAGSKGFSIIEQGAIGKIITAKPLDRRVLIEEAAGITKFKVRKKESQRKLVSTDQNLLRLKDIILELKRQIESLQRQAKKAERYKELKDKAEDLDLLAHSHQYTKINADVVESQKQHEQLNNEYTLSKTNLSNLEAEIESFQLKLLENEKLVEHKQLQYDELQATLKQKESEIQRLNFEIEQVQRDAQMQGSVSHELKAKRTVHEEQLNKINEEFKSLDSVVADLKQKYHVAEEEYQNTLTLVQSIDEELTKSRRDLIAMTQAKTQVEANIVTFQTRLEDVGVRKSEIENQLSELNNKKVEYEKYRSKVFTDLELERQLQLSIMTDVKNLEDNKNQLNQQLQAKKIESEQFKDELNQVTSRLQGLEELQVNFEGFEQGVKNVMLWKKAQKQIHVDGSVTEILPVAEAIEVPSEYEVAMEATLGSRIQMLLSESNDDSLMALNYLKENKAGRSSFLAQGEGSGFLAQGESKEIPLNNSPRSADGVRAILNEVIQVPEKFKSSMTLLVGHVAIVDNIRSALRLRPIYKGWSFVTLDGDTLSADGVLTGGDSESSDSGVLKRRREIKELTLKKEEMSGKVALAQASVKKIEEQFERIQLDLENAQKIRLEKEIRLTEMKKDLERAEVEVKTVSEACNKQQVEQKEVLATFNRINESLNNESARLENFKTKKSELEQLSLKLDQNILAAKSSIDLLREKSTQSKVDWVAKDQSKIGLQNQIDMLKISLNDVDSQMNRLAEESDKNSTSLNERFVKLEQENIQLNNLISINEALRLETARLRDIYQSESHELLKKRERASQVQREQSSKQSTMNDCHLKVEQLKMKLQYIQNHIREKYMLLIDDVAPKYVNREYNSTAVDAELEDLRDKLKKMGEVNLSAIQEYGEINQRYEFLVKQEQDLIEAKDSLRRVIDRINRICNKRFKDTFAAVNERFQKVFPVLFGGGQAELLLITIENQDELGIDIVAKPPGKKLQNISLMSGGEKALTSVALIFSIFLVKPSPFCLLDEVDAPLDDANVFRFNDLVREMAKRSQIIVVTHNKHTMEINEKLYGVTMQEKGVSKMVSVSLAEAQNVAHV